jgi:hypothetical protein
MTKEFKVEQIFGLIGTLIAWAATCMTVAGGLYGAAKLIRK